MPLGARVLAHNMSLCIALGVLLASSPLALAAERAANEGLAPSAANNQSIRIDGGPIGTITSSPLALTPAFDPSITDYVWRCQSGTNTINLLIGAAPGRTIKIGQRSGSSLQVTATLLENQALIIETANAPGRGGRVEFWIRCLPHDFPQLSVSRPADPPPGWYLTGNLNSASGSGTYAMVLDNNGTPVWYQKSLGTAFNLSLFSRNQLAWISTARGFGGDPTLAYQIYDIQTQKTQWITTAAPPLDPHEIVTLPKGHVMLMSIPLKANVDVRSLGGTRATIVDCVVQEIDKQGRLVWQWRGSDHISLSESVHPLTINVRQQVAYDPFHCNSIDVDPVSGNVLVSARETDSLYLIDKTTGMIIWKLGGTAANHDHAKHIVVVGSPESAFDAQHDARFQPNGDISMYDDESYRNQAARGAEYHIDVMASSATLVWSYASPDGHNSLATGSFRRFDGGMDNVIGWGYKTGTLFTEVGPGGDVMLDVKFPNGEAAYRVAKVAIGDLDLRLLRASAGAPQVMPKPVVYSVDPQSGPVSGGEAINITGIWFTGATRVRIGQRDVAFRVMNDRWIVATTPAGLGSAAVVVTAPGGQSSQASFDQMASTASDASFEFGTGSWSGGSEASVSISNAYSRSGLYSLKVVPAISGPVSTGTAKYYLPGPALFSGTGWVLTPSGSDRVHLALSFFDANQALLGSASGSIVASSAATWTSLHVTAETPVGTIWVSVSVVEASPAGAEFLDDMSLSGPSHYLFES